MVVKKEENKPVPSIEEALKALRKQFGDDAAMTFESGANKDIEWITANVPKLMQTTPTLELINSLMEK